MNRYDFAILATLRQAEGPLGTRELLRASHIDSGRLHPALTRLEDAGLIHSEHELQPDPTRVARRLYALTAAGARRAQTPIGATR